jgi:hypothetical protein
MDEIESKFLKYYQDISAAMVQEGATFDVMTKKLVDEFNKFGLTNEQKAQALSQIYSSQIEGIEAKAVQAALALLQEERETDLADKQMEVSDKQIELSDEQIATEKRKQQGYDDNLLIEIMKAQGSLASFAVNANSDTAQDTIDDLKFIMKVVEDRACDIVCDTPTFNLEYETPYNTPLSGNVFGTTGLTYSIIEQPEKGTLVVNDDGTFLYTPQNDTDGIGLFYFKIKSSDDTMSVVTSVSVTVTDIA